MVVLVVGATGAVGRPLVQQLVCAGHEVIGTTLSAQQLGQLSSAGATGIVVDAFDSSALRHAIVTASPHVVIDELTALSRPLRPGGYDEWLQTTNALRRDVTPALVKAAREAGASRVIAQSAAFMTAPTGPDIVDESAPLYLDAPKPLIGTISSNVALEAVVTQAQDIDGVVLRYGFLYGPGTTYAPNGDLIKQIREGEFPIVGNGEGRFPFIHVHDAAAATVLALDHGSTGIYNVVDDNPAPMREWVPYVADLLGAPRPATIPAERAERQLVYYGTELRGASNDKARRELGFSPLYPDWRDGIRASLSDAAPAPAVDVRPPAR